MLHTMYIFHAAIVCDDLADPINGNIRFSADRDRKSPFDYGTVAEYVCDLGYELSSSDLSDHSRSCDGTASSSEGYWTGFELSCEGTTIVHQQ